MFKYFKQLTGSNIPADNANESQKTEKITFRLHIFSQILNGTAVGIFLLQDILLKKSLFASDFQIALIIFLIHSSLLFSIYGVEIINRAHNRGKAIIILGLISKFFLFIIPISENPLWFIFCIAAMSYLDAFIKPFWNIVLKHNYSDRKRSIYYSYATAVNLIFILIASTLLGFILDINYEYYKFLFPLAGILDIIAYFNLSKMIHLKIEAVDQTSEKFSGGISLNLLKDILISPVRSMLKIFRDNKEFFRFEQYFMAYGVAFMMMTTAIPIYFVEVLMLGYIPISIARGVVSQGASIIFSPIAGRLFGHGNPMNFTGFVFIILSLFPLTMLLLGYDDLVSLLSIEMLIYIAYFMFGIGMSGVNLSWTLSSIYYAPPPQVSNYQAVHITLTGIRGVFSPFLGYAIMKIFSVGTVFVISALLLVSAGWLMLYERKLQKLRSHNQP